MCWSAGATATMVGLGAAATAVSVWRGDKPVFSATIGFFTLMEGLQLYGYSVINQCGTPQNETITLLSILHIVFQPLFINAFFLAFAAVALRPSAKVATYLLCGLSSVVMLMQLMPFSWAGLCEPGSILCGKAWCTISGDWHQAWTVPFNGMMTWLDRGLGQSWGFPTYMLAAFLLPALYGAWRLALFHLIAGPGLAGFLTRNPNEIPAVWCLFSISIVLVIMLPQLRRYFTWTPWPGLRAEQPRPA